MRIVLSFFSEVLSLDIQRKNFAHDFGKHRFQVLLNTLPNHDGETTFYAKLLRFWLDGNEIEDIYLTGFVNFTKNSSIYSLTFLFHLFVNFFQNLTSELRFFALLHFYDGKSFLTEKLVDILLDGDEIGGTNALHFFRKYFESNLDEAVKFLHLLRKKEPNQFKEILRNLISSFPSPINEIIVAHFSPNEPQTEPKLVHEIYQLLHFQPTK